MNIHLPAILMFTRGTRFWDTAKSVTRHVILESWLGNKSSKWIPEKITSVSTTSGISCQPNKILKIDKDTVSPRVLELIRFLHFCWCIRTSKKMRGGHCLWTASSNVVDITIPIEPQNTGHVGRRLFVVSFSSSSSSSSFSSSSSSSPPPSLSSSWWWSSSTG